MQIGINIFSTRYNGLIKTNKIVPVNLLVLTYNHLKLSFSHKIKHKFTSLCWLFWIEAKTYINITTTWQSSHWKTKIKYGVKTRGLKFKWIHSKILINRWIKNRMRLLEIKLNTCNRYVLYSNLSKLSCEIGSSGAETNISSAWF